MPESMITTSEESTRNTAEELELLRIDLWGVTTKAMALPLSTVSGSAAEEVEALKISTQLGILTRALARRGITPADPVECEENAKQIKTIQARYIS